MLGAVRVSPAAPDGLPVKVGDLEAHALHATDAGLARHRVVLLAGPVIAKEAID